MQSITVKARFGADPESTEKTMRTQIQSSTTKQQQDLHLRHQGRPGAQGARGIHFEELSSEKQCLRGDVYDQDQKSPGLSPHDAASNQQNYRGAQHGAVSQSQLQSGGKSVKRGGHTESQILGQADSLRERAIKHCLKQEYFDVLTYTHRCSKLVLQLVPDLTQKNPRNSAETKQSTRMEEDLKILRRINQSAFLILKDCLIYSSIAYIQLQQYEQAVSLTTPLIELEDVDESVLVDNQYLVPALLIRAQAKELMGQDLKSLTDLENGQRLQPDNQFVKNQIDRLKSSIQKKYLQEQKTVEIKRKENRSKSNLRQKKNFKNLNQLNQLQLNQLIHVRKLHSASVNSPLKDQLNVKPLVSVQNVDKECSAKETLKTPERRLSLEYEIMETQATHNKSLHPATPSQIKFDFDEDGQYSSDGTRQQQEVLNYLMLGAKQSSQQRNASKSGANEKQSKVDQNNFDLCQLNDKDNQKKIHPSPKFAASKPTGKGSCKTQQLDMIAQIVLLLRQLCRYIGKNKWLQLLIIAITSFYAFMCYRLVRYFHALMKREQVMGTLAYRPQDLSHAVCHYIMLVLDQTFKRLQK